MPRIYEIVKEEENQELENVFRYVNFGINFAVFRSNYALMKTYSLWLSAFLIGLAVLSSCNKGKRMPQTVCAEVQTTGVEVDMGPNFSPSHYSNVLEADYQLATIQEKLTRYLKRNNIKMKDDRAIDYRIQISAIDINEQFGSATYTDTCVCPYVKKEVPISIVSYRIDVAIINAKNNTTVDILSRTITEEESISGCDSCGEPGVSKIDITKIVDALTKELRKEIAEVIYIDMGF